MGHRERITNKQSSETRRNKTETYQRRGRKAD